jgi:hypothetical protein
MREDEEGRASPIQGRLAAVVGPMSYRARLRTRILAFMLTSFAGLCILMVAVTVPIIACSKYGLYRGYSLGERAGVIVKFSRKGLVWKSWEGAMNLGGMVETSERGMVPELWAFSVHEDSVAEQVLEAYRKGDRVLLRYEQYAISPIWVETAYDIVAVEAP